MRVALCLSGQMRTYKECYEALDRYLLQELQPDIFIHTWSGSGISHKEIGSNSFLDDEIVIEEMERLYHPVKCVIETYHSDYSDILHDKSVPLILKQKQPVHYRGALPLFYKIFECNRLKCEYEHNQRLQYDLVIRLRPDLLLSKAIPNDDIREARNSRKLFYEADLLDPAFQMSDKYAFSSSEIMDKYCGLWKSLDEYWKYPLGNGNEAQHRVGERLMRHHLTVSELVCVPFYCKCSIRRLNDGELDKCKS